MGLHSLEEVIEILQADPTIGLKGAEYVNKKHNPIIVFPTLLENITNSKLSANDIKATAENISRAYATIRKIVSLKKNISISQ